VVDEDGYEDSENQSSKGSNTSGNIMSAVSFAHKDKSKDTKG